MCPRLTFSGTATASTTSEGGKCINAKWRKGKPFCVVFSRRGTVCRTIKLSFRRNDDKLERLVGRSVNKEKDDEEMEKLLLLDRLALVATFRKDWL